MQWGTRNALNHGLRYLVPLLLCLSFICLAIVGNNRVEEPPAEPAPIDIPFTRLAVENRLTDAGFVWAEDTLSGTDGYAYGKLTALEKDGLLIYIRYEVKALGDLSDYKGDSDYASLLTAQNLEAKTTRRIYRILMNAMTPALELTEKQVEEGEKKLNNCLKEEKSYRYTLKGWGFSFSSTDHAPFRTVTFTLYKLQEEEAGGVKSE